MNSRNGTIGCAARSSTATNRASITTPATSGIRGAGAVQPMSAASTMPKTRAVEPAVARSAPATSKRPLRRSVSGRNRTADTTIAMPTGTFEEEPGPPRDQVGDQTPTTRPRAAPSPATAL
ncbi:hypothetical protein [Streptomyces phaeochromogenes]